MFGLDADNFRQCVNDTGFIKFQKSADNGGDIASIATGAGEMGGGVATIAAAGGATVSSGGTAAVVAAPAAGA